MLINCKVVEELLAIMLLLSMNIPFTLFTPRLLRSSTISERSVGEERCTTCDAVLSLPETTANTAMPSRDPSWKMKSVWKARMKPSTYEW